MSCSAQKFLAAGHIGSFRYTLTKTYARFMIPLFMCVDGGPQENLRAAVIC